jgi:hypothetical protein
MTPDDLYLKIIPELERQDEAIQALKRGKTEVYAFRTKLSPSEINSSIDAVEKTHERLQELFVRHENALITMRDPNRTRAAAGSKSASSICPCHTCHGCHILYQT